MLYAISLFLLTVFGAFFIFCIIMWIGLFLSQKSGDAMKTLVVLGSGGHTTEMLGMLSSLPSTLTTRMIFIIAATDTMSETKLRAQYPDLPSSAIRRTPRAREVGQSYQSSVPSTLTAAAHAFYTVLDTNPSLVLCNGPGTCVPVAMAAKALRTFGLLPGGVPGGVDKDDGREGGKDGKGKEKEGKKGKKEEKKPAGAAAKAIAKAQKGVGCKIVFVESIARVKTLSLSGQILYSVADLFLVQWPQLEEKFPKARNIGFIV